MLCTRPTHFVLDQHTLYQANTLCTRPTHFVLDQHTLYQANTLCTRPTHFVLGQHALYQASTLCTRPTHFVLCQHTLYQTNTLCTRPTRRVGFLQLQLTETTVRGRHAGIGKATRHAQLALPSRLWRIEVRYLCPHVRPVNYD